MSVWTNPDIKRKDKFTLWVTLMVVLLVLVPPVGLIFLGIFFPLYLIYMLFSSIYWAIHDRITS